MSAEKLAELAAGLTRGEARALILCVGHTHSWFTAPKDGRRRTSCMTGIAAKGLAERRFEKANGLNWYRLTSDGAALRNLLATRPSGKGE